MYKDKTAGTILHDFIIMEKKKVRNRKPGFFSKFFDDIIVNFDKNDKKKPFKTAKTI